MDEAARTQSGGAVCPVCPRGCALEEGRAGFCRARVARGGAVVDENYGRLTALALDPIEKKPLARFFPGSRVLSVGSYGCNLRCPFCQNHEISQRAEAGAWRETTPEQLVDEALALRGKGNIGLAYTYNEPGVGFEFVRDTSRLAKQAGLENVMVTNGYMNPGPFGVLLETVDAMNIDLKCFTEEGYRALGGALSPVQQSIRAAAGKIHLEVTTLVVPGLSDGEADMEAQAAWLAALSPEIPLHISRYFPRWNAQTPPTPPGVIHRLVDVAQKYLRHVYTGNL